MTLWRHWILLNFLKNNMGISFFVTAYNEYEDLKRLLGQLTQVIKHSDE